MLMLPANTVMLLIQTALHNPTAASSNHPCNQHLSSQCIMWTIKHGQYALLRKRTTNKSSQGLKKPKNELNVPMSTIGSIAQIASSEFITLNCSALLPVRERNHNYGATYELFGQGKQLVNRASSAYECGDCEW